MKNVYLFLFALILISCGNTADKNMNETVETTEQKEHLPEEEQIYEVHDEEVQQFKPKLSYQLELNFDIGFQVVDSIRGNLDKDGVEELVVAYNTKIVDPNDFSTSVPRKLIIYKKGESKWEVWKSSSSALMGSLDGGAMGDPFESMDITNGVLTINHWGGSSWKWGETDKYRFQNGDFYLIGYTTFSGRVCDNWVDHDFNLSTGKIISKQYKDACEDDSYEGEKIDKKEEEYFYKDLKISLQNRNRGDVLIKSSDGIFSFYI